jgi:hypothetical protein
VFAVPEKLKPIAHEVTNKPKQGSVGMNEAEKFFPSDSEPMSIGPPNASGVSVPLAIV